MKGKEYLVSRREFLMGAGSLLVLVPAETSRALMMLGRDEQDLEVLWFDGAAERRRVGTLMRQAT